MKTSPIYLLLSGLLLLCCISCQTLQPRKLPPQATSFDESLRKLAARSDHWRGYQAKLRIRADGAKGKMRFQAIVLASLPDQLRLEAFSLVGQTVALFTMSNARPALWIPSEKMIFTAERPETLIEYFFGIPLPAGVFAYNLAAVVPPGQIDKLHPRGDASGWKAESDSDGTNTSWRWEFTAQPPALKSVAVKDGPWECRITYDPPVGLEPQDMPRKIRLESAQWQMDITVEQIVPAASLEASAFGPPVQSGIRTVDLDSIK
jgi:outer membrane biogenesis lipoprotein LolB